MEFENIVQNQTNLIQLSIHGPCPQVIVVLFLCDVPLVPTPPMCELLYPEVPEVIEEEQPKFGSCRAVKLLLILRLYG